MKGYSIDELYNTYLETYDKISKKLNKSGYTPDEPKYGKKQFQLALLAKRNDIKSRTSYNITSNKKIAASLADEQVYARSYKQALVQRQREIALGLKPTSIMQARMTGIVGTEFEKRMMAEYEKQLKEGKSTVEIAKYIGVHFYGSDPV